jgi:hypothetical protein
LLQWSFFLWQITQNKNNCYAFHLKQAQYCTHKNDNKFNSEYIKYFFIIPCRFFRLNFFVFKLLDLSGAFFTLVELFLPQWSFWTSVKLFNLIGAFWIRWSFFTSVKFFHVREAFSPQRSSFWPEWSFLTSVKLFDLSGAFWPQRSSFKDCYNFKAEQVQGVKL